MTQDPVRPPPPSEPGGGAAGTASSGQGPEEVNLKEAIMDDPIIGVEQQDEGAIEAKPLRSPPVMTPAQREIHNLTHQPPHPGCEICRATRTPNIPHSLSHESSRTIPMLVGDYCFLKSGGEKKLLTCLVMKLYPWKIFLACGVPKKGIDQSVISRISRFIREMGLVTFVYRCDREASLNAMLEEAISRTGRAGRHFPRGSDASSFPLPIAEVEDDEPDAVTVHHEVPAGHITLSAAPELTHPGESQSNGLAERAVRTLEEQTRTMLTALEARIKVPLPSDHPILSWLLEHASYILNKYMTGPDKKTAYYRMHGKETNERLVEFGERVLWFVPKKLRSKLDRPWNYGVFLGRSISSDQNFIGVAGGQVVRARAMIRLVPSARWDLGRLLGVQVTPLQEHSSFLDSIETHDAPHDFDATNTSDDTVHSKRRLRITLKDLDAFGFSPQCPKCQMHERHEHKRAQFYDHTESCRARIYDALRKSGASKIVHTDAERTKTKTKASEKSADPQGHQAAGSSASSSGHGPEPAAPQVNDEDDAAHLFAPDPDDQTEFYQVVNDDHEIMDNARALEGEPAYIHDFEEEHSTMALLDTLQTNGVEPAVAANFAASLVKDKPRFRDLHARMKATQSYLAAITDSTPSFIEVYGKGQAARSSPRVSEESQFAGT